MQSMKRPECGRELEERVYGEHYRTMYHADADAEIYVNALNGDDVRFLNLEQMEFDVDRIGRDLPNETYMSVVSDKLGRINIPNVKRGFLNQPDVIKDAGYKVEVHNVITSDGYILEMHRITGEEHENNSNKKKIPVLLMHGLIESSGCWVLMGKELGLGKCYVVINCCASLDYSIAHT